MDTLQKALDLYRLTNDPLALDAIRALETPTTPKCVKNTVENYLQTQYDAALTLYGNSGKHPNYGFDHRQPTDFSE